MTPDVPPHTDTGAGLGRQPGSVHSRTVRPRLAHRPDGPEDEYGNQNDVTHFWN